MTRPALLSALMLAGAVPAWWLGGAIVEATGLIVLDLPIRVACLFLLLNLAGEAIDRLATAGRGR